MKKYAFYAVIVLVSVVAVGFAVNAFVGTEAPKVVVEGDYIEAQDSESIGAIAGPDHYGDFRVHGRFLQGGGVNTETVSATATTNVLLTTADIRDYSQTDVTMVGVVTTLTLPATSTITGFIQYTGECVDYLVRNITATAASTTTITAGTGMDLVEAGDGSVTNVVIAGGNGASLKFCRESDTDITVYVTEFSPAD